jgi:hypothetical protein
MAYRKKDPNLSISLRIAGFVNAGEAQLAHYCLKNHTVNRLADHWLGEGMYPYVRMYIQYVVAVVCRPLWARLALLIATNSSRALQTSRGSFYHCCFLINWVNLE